MHVKMGLRSQWLKRAWRFRSSGPSVEASKPALGSPNIGRTPKLTWDAAWQVARSPSPVAPASDWWRSTRPAIRSLSTAHRSGWSHAACDAHGQEVHEVRGPKPSGDAVGSVSLVPLPLGLVP